MIVKGINNLTRRMETKNGYMFALEMLNKKLCLLQQYCDVIVTKKGKIYTVNTNIPDGKDHKLGMFDVGQEVYTLAYKMHQDFRLDYTWFTDCIKKYIEDDCTSNYFSNMRVNGITESHMLAYKILSYEEGRVDIFKDILSLITDLNVEGAASLDNIVRTHCPAGIKCKKILDKFMEDYDEYCEAQQELYAEVEEAEAV